MNWQILLFLTPLRPLFKEKTYFLIRHALDPHTWCSSIVEYVNSILNTK